MDRGFNEGTVCQRRPYNRLIIGVWFTIIFLLLSIVSTTSQIMEEDILNYLSTVMFRGTPCYVKFQNYRTLFPKNLVNPG